MNIPDTREIHNQYACCVKSLECTALKQYCGDCYYRFNSKCHISSNMSVKKFEAITDVDNTHTLIN